MINLWLMTLSNKRKNEFDFLLNLILNSIENEFRMMLDYSYSICSVSKHDFRKHLEKRKILP